MSSPPFGPIVSSAHLASGAMPALSEFEFGLIMLSHAMQRWYMRCMAAAGDHGLSVLENMILHSVHHRGRPKKLADIALVLNIEDTHLVTYAVKKLEKAGLIKGVKIGKEKAVSTTKKGADLCDRYQMVREEILVKSAKATGLDEAALSRLATEIRVMSGLYDQAARSAASL